MTEIEALTKRIRAVLTLVEVEAQTKYPNKPNIADMLDNLNKLSVAAGNLRIELMRQNKNI